MDTINFVIVISLLGSLAGIVIMGRVLLSQFREVRRPRNAFTRLRWYLLALPTIYILAVVLRLPRLLELLYVPHANLSAAVASLASTVVILGFAIFAFLIYSFREKR